MADIPEPYLPSAEEIKARCAQIQSEWTIAERLSRGRVTLIQRTASEYLHQPRRRRNPNKARMIKRQPELCPEMA